MSNVELGDGEPSPQQTRNSEVLADFSQYCADHPNHRFWQALRNWSGYHFVFVSDMDYRDLSAAEPRDTFSFEGKRHESGAAQEVSPRSWSEQMAQVQPCGHTEAQHMYHTEGYIKLDLSECTSNGGPSIPAKAEAHKADAVKAVSASSAQEVSPPSPTISYGPPHNGDGEAGSCTRCGSIHRGDTRELKAALKGLLECEIYCQCGGGTEPDSHADNCPLERAEKLLG